MPVALLDTTIAQALGWTLAHFLWEGAAIAALLAFALFIARPASARVRYALACIALAAMLASFAGTLAILWPAAASVAVRSGLPAATAAGDGALAAFPPGPSSDRLSWIVPFWMAGVFIFYVRSAGGWLAAQRLYRRGTIAAPPEWQRRVRELAARLRVTRPALLLESSLAESPVVIGFLRPAILVPAGLLTGLTPGQLESILLHELAHIRRYDYAVNLMQSLVEGLLFYHPAVWWISGLVRAERENCCDDAVVNAMGDARGYAAALAALEERRAAGQPALAATGGNLMKRIRRLLEPEKPRSIAGPLLGSALLIVTVALGLSAWQPQREPAPGPALTAQSKPQAEEMPRKEIASHYRKWADEDVVYIIDDRERAAFEQLRTDEERERFIEQFWERRDPTPGTLENEFKTEHYRRIAYANQRFAEPGLPGWRTARGRIYIVNGPPDEIEDHADRQAWRYRHLPGLGDNVDFLFKKDSNGQFELMPQAGRAAAADLGSGSVERALAVD